MTGAELRGPMTPRGGQGGSRDLQRSLGSTTGPFLIRAAHCAATSTAVTNADVTLAPAASEAEDPGALKLPLYYPLVCTAPEFKKYEQSTDTRREESQQAADLVLLRPAWLGDLCILVPGPSCSVLFPGGGCGSPTVNKAFTPVTSLLLGQRQTLGSASRSQMWF